MSLPPPADLAHVDTPDVDDCEPLPADPMAALDKLTQLNGASKTIGSHACGAVCLLAATITTQGYDGLVHLASQLRDELSDYTRIQLEQLAAAVAQGKEGATFGALANFALILHRRYRGFDGGMPYEKLLHLMKMAGFQPPKAIDDDHISTTITRQNQCWPAKISLHGGEGDHWILVGKDNQGFFIYDPYPREDCSQLVRPEEPDWNAYVKAIGQDEDNQDTIGFLPGR